MAKKHSVNPPEVDAILDTVSAAMDAQGMTEYRLAKLTELDPTGLGRIMAREARPKLETALRMLAAVGKKWEIISEK